MVKHGIKKCLCCGLALSGLLTAMSVSALAAEVKVGVVNASSLHLRQEPSTGAKSLETAEDGEKVVVLEQKGDWYQVVYQGGEGYMHSDYLTVSPEADFPVGGGVVTGSSVNFRKAPSTDASVIKRLGKDAQVEVVGVKSGWYKVKSGDKTGYIHPDFLRVAKSVAEMVVEAEDEVPLAAVADTDDEKAALRAEIVAYAKEFLGCKYRYGSMNGKTFDCSGFTSYVYKHFGYALGRSAASQVSDGKKVASRDDLKLGDIVLFRDPSINRGAASHVGIYVGKGQFIHSSSRGGGVKYNSLSDNYYNRYYIGARRIVD
ncbi:MAG: SH3 domain-containing protein [Oscillospiraceae bacterium]|jgi:cell wall-associated NlpC family hydrolase|nr:SH3 domain-containing protein [Oscillospiraceae bacterium]